MENSKNTSRRRFIGNSAALGALGAIGVSQLVQSCNSGNTGKPIPMPTILDMAPDGPLLKAGVVGCGARGTGAAINFLNAGPNLTIHAVADLFQDRIDGIRQNLKEMRNVEVDDANCFVGLDAYKRLLDTDVDVVILATPPYFRPEQFLASVEARKHVFMEKPVAVDPVGARSVMATSKQAEAAGLCVVTGTQRRHSHDYLDIYSRVKGGAIGDLVSLNVYWNGGKVWHRDPQPDWTDMEYMIRDWVNWTWLSGDHIVEQHIHNLDVANWFMGQQPLEVIGVGSRLRRLTGDCYNFSLDFVYDNNVHMGSMCRQINDCANGLHEYIRGTKGYTDCESTIWNPDGSIMYQHDYISEDDRVVYPYTNTSVMHLPKNETSAQDQEHINLITAIRTGEQLVTAEETAKSTMVAIMGRIAAYTGKKVTWEEMMSSDMKLGPAEITMGPVNMKAVVPIAGTAPE